MIEIYLFVNPLGTECLCAEKQILNLLQNEFHKKIHFHFIPFVNIHVVNAFIYNQHLNGCSLTLRNEIFNQLYTAALDYKAIQLQGKKIGRSFLLEIQQQCGIEKKAYSTALVESIVKKVGADLDEFHLDRASSLVKEAFLEDQKVAHDMNVTENPSCVIYNYSCERDFGVLLKGKEWCKNKEAIKKLCHTHQDDQQTPFYSSFPLEDSNPLGHIHLL